MRRKLLSVNDCCHIVFAIDRAAACRVADDQMSETDSVAIASRRLTLALDALEGAAERRRETDRNEEALATQIHALGNDRARLASELDRATASARSLKGANREVARRIDQAIETIRSVLANIE
jgi:3-oxoacyl-(acyl-carrier-protein) synthase